MIGGNTILKSIFSITLVGILLGGHTYKPSIEQFLIGFSDAIYLGSAQSIAGFILIFTICNVLLIPTLMLNLLAGYFWGTLVESNRDQAIDRRNDLLHIIQRDRRSTHAQKIQKLVLNS